MNARIGASRLLARRLAALRTRVKRLPEQPLTQAVRRPSEGVYAMFRKLIFAAACLTSTAALAAPPRHFLEDAIKGDNSEIALGRLIASRGTAPTCAASGTRFTAITALPAARLSPSPGRSG